MDLCEKANHYLASHTYREGHVAAVPHETSYPFLTISRETGAGAHSLALALLKEMAQHSEPLWHDWKIFDAATCSQILEDAKLKATFESLHKEETRSAWEETIYELVGGRAPTDLIFRKTFHAMRLVAGRGKVIVIGRGGACATKDLPLGIHMRLIAPLATRVYRTMERFHTSDSNARRIIAHYDAERAKFVRVHFGRDIDDPLLYHLIWNTDRTSYEEIARHMWGMLRSRIGEIHDHNANVFQHHMS